MGVGEWNGGGRNGMRLEEWYGMEEWYGRVTTDIVIGRRMYKYNHTTTGA